MAGILFIDAEQPFADQMVGSLKSRGFAVKLLDDGKDGLDYAKDHSPDLIVLCVELPKMSGYSICNKLKKDNDLKGIPLIITSKEATPETIVQHKKLKTRAEDYLIKPFTEADLVSKIGALIAMPSGGAAAPAPAEQDPFDALESLGADLDLPADVPAASGESEVRIEDGDLGGLDGDLGDLGAAPSLKGVDLRSDVGLSDDQLLAGLEDLGGGSASAPLPSDPDDLGDLAEFAALDDPPAPAPPPPVAPARSTSMGPSPRSGSGVPMAAAEPPRAEAKPELPRTSSSTLPTAADVQQLTQLRRENSDLKAKLGELEARLRAAEESARSKDAALQASAQSSGSSTARETLALKEQMRAKEKEIGTLKDEVFEKEKTNVELQEQIESVRAQAEGVRQGMQAKDVEISSLQARVNALAEERDGLVEQMQAQVRQAEGELEQARVDLQRAKSELERARAFEDKLKSDVDRARAEKTQLESKIKDVQAEAQNQEDRAAKAYQRIKSEEAVREKAKKAVEIAFSLLNGDVDTGGKALDLELDAE